MKAALAFALVLLASAALAAGAGMDVPAVITNGGGEMVWAAVEVSNGTGLIYTSTSPLVGTETQQSERAAVGVAMGVLGRDASKYDAFLTMNVSNTNEVDGPSAGAAMTLLTIAALNGSRVRSDMTITGTIEDDGSIGPVGGIVEKVEAASGTGLRVALVPRESDVSDKIILASLRRKLNMTIVEVDDVQTAASIAFSPAGSAITVPESPVPTPIQGLSAYQSGCSNCGVEAFGELARTVVSEGSSAVEALRSENASSYSDVLPYLEKDDADAKSALANGYYYTAANTAFLNRVDAAMLRNTSLNRSGLMGFLSEVDGCVAQLERPALTRENLQWVVGGDLRAEWAKKKVNETRVGVAMLSDDNYESLLAAYREALYAQGWCSVAGAMYAEAGKTGGSGANESALETTARARVHDAELAYEGIGGGDEDTAWHLGAAQQSLNDSRYAAAVFDADYVVGAVKAANESATNEEADANAILAQKGKVMWSALFFAHASYYHSINPRSSGTVLRLGRIAQEMENDSLGMDSILANPSAQPAATPTPSPAQGSVEKLNGSLVTLIVLLCVLLAASAVLNIIVITFAHGRRKEEANALVKEHKKLQRKRA